MNYLSAENLSKSFNERQLFANITFGINRGQKIALVGPNGCGKTTLFRILAGQEKSDTGIVVLNKSIRFAYLDQDPYLDPELPVIDVLFATGNDTTKAIKAYEHSMLHPEDIDAMQTAIEMMDNMKAWDYEQKVKQIVSRLGVINFEQKVKTLSGGQKKRLALARVLIEEPDLLLLDEPTNHLDIETIEWLENTLSGSQMTMLLITHDRYFLDAVCNEVVEIDNGEIYKYRGNYSYFLEKKDERETQQAATVDKARNLMRKELEWMRRQPKARGTKAKYRVDAFDDLKEKAAGKKTNDKLELSVTTSYMGSKVLELNHISHGYQNKELIKEFSYTFKKKDRIGIVGRNGAGKTTLLNILTKQLQPQVGNLSWGETTIFGYYSQSGLILQEDMRVIEWAKEFAEVVKMADGSTISVGMLLQHFLFTPTQQHGYISKLSGGERKRLMLLGILLKSPNFLVLDEPTNDLDIQTLNVLEDFLVNYPGCLIVVSHDRYFMDKLIDHVFVFEGDGYIRDFPGNYTDYREWKKEQEDTLKTPGKKKDSDTRTSAAPVATIVSSEKKKMSFKEKTEYETLEKEIEKLEAEKAELYTKLTAGTENVQELTAWSKRIEEIDKTLEAKSTRWIELAEKA